MLFSSKEKAQGLVEYALLFVLIAILFVVVMMLLGTVLQGIFDNIQKALAEA